MTARECKNLPGADVRRGQEFAELARTWHELDASCGRNATMSRKSLLLVLALVLAEEVEARGKLEDSVLAGILTKLGGKLARRGKSVLPAEEVLLREAHVLGNELAPGRHGGVHQQGRRAKGGKGVREGGHVGVRVIAGGLARRVPTLVGRTSELLHRGKGAVEVHPVDRTLKRKRRLAAFLDDLGTRLHRRQLAIARLRGAVEAAARQAVEDVREKCALLEGRVHHARVVLDEDY